MTPSPHRPFPPLFHLCALTQRWLLTGGVGSAKMRVLTRDNNNGGRVAPCSQTSYTFQASASSAPPLLPRKQRFQRQRIEAFGI